MLEAPNPWRKAVLRELAAGRIRVADAARIAAVSERRIGQWCRQAGIDPAAAWDRRITQFYARELLRITKARVSPVIAGLVRRRARKGPSKRQLRKWADQAVIDFQARKRALRKPKP